jgi:hypothetical protein
MGSDYGHAGNYMDGLHDITSAKFQMWRRSRAIRAFERAENTL